MVTLLPKRYQKIWKADTMYPRVDPTLEHHTEMMSRMMNHELSFTTSMRTQNVGYARRHRIGLNRERLTTQLRKS